jgi:tetratricopeptide (TPR) repeat protein
LACSAVTAGAGLPVHADPVVEARVDSLVRAAVDHAFAGRLDLGHQTIDVAQEVAPRDPRIGLTRYRLLRENYPVSVFQKELARVQEPALIRELDYTIALCDSMLEVDETDAAAYLYRGWAYINKAQTQLIARRMRAAAGSSRNGKNDFDKFYEAHPEGDPDAATVMGAFLFYADTLPGFFKFIRWLVRVPGGDRERGLALLKEGAAGRGYTYPDALLILGVTYYLFDGNLEESSRILKDAIARYPRHPWVVEYTCSMSYLHPEFTGPAISYQSAMLEGWDDTTRGWGETVRYRVIWSLGREYYQLGEYETALGQMSTIVMDSPAEPARIVPNTHLSAIRLAGHLGRAHDVKWLCENIPDEERYKQMKDSFASACGRVAGREQAQAFAALGEVRRTLYSGSVEQASRLLDDAVAQFGTDADSRYLQAEVSRSLGNTDEAAAVYAEVAEMAVATGHFQLSVQAHIRRGEIFISQGDYESAKKAYEGARDTEPGESMLANFIRGRLRYIERQKD